MISSGDFRDEGEGFRKVSIQDVDEDSIRNFYSDFTVSKVLLISIELSDAFHLKDVFLVVLFNYYPFQAIS